MTGAASLAALAFAVAAAAGFALGPRRAAWLCAGLVALGLGLFAAGRMVEGMRGLAFAAVLVAGGLPALCGAAIGGGAGWWQRRRRHGA